MKQTEIVGKLQTALQIVDEVVPNPTDDVMMKFESKYMLQMTRLTLLTMVIGMLDRPDFTISPAKIYCNEHLPVPEHPKCATCGKEIKPEPFTPYSISGEHYENRGATRTQ